jgi:AbrB family looped-hinge helix DNA binding protein
MKSITKHTKGEVMDKNQYIGICKVGEKGQIVIPKQAREMFDIKAGDSVIVLCDKQKGMAIVKPDVIEDLTNKVLG